MNTSISAGASIPADDMDILQAMIHASNLSGARSEATGRTWNVAVRNDDGQLYRRTGFRNLNQMRRLGMRMKALGYVDELGGVRDQKNGLDAIYRRRPETADRRESGISAAA